MCILPCVCICKQFVLDYSKVFSFLFWGLCGDHGLLIASIAKRKPKRLFVHIKCFVHSFAPSHASFQSFPQLQNDERVNTQTMHAKMCIDFIYFCKKKKNIGQNHLKREKGRLRKEYFVMDCLYCTTCRLLALFWHYVEYMFVCVLCVCESVNKHTTKIFSSKTQFHEQPHMFTFLCVFFYFLCLFAIYLPVPFSCSFSLIPSVYWFLQCLTSVHLDVTFGRNGNGSVVNTNQ